MTRLRSERGSALIAGMMAIMLMMMLGFAAMSFVDGQSSSTRQSRVQESAFNTSGGGPERRVVHARARLARISGQPDAGLHVRERRGHLVLRRRDPLPDATTMAQTLTGSDVTGSGNVSWTVESRDNGGTEQCTSTTAVNCSYFSDKATTRNQPTWDANADNRCGSAPRPSCAGSGARSSAACG